MRSASWRPCGGHNQRLPRVCLVVWFLHSMLAGNPLAQASVVNGGRAVIGFPAQPLEPGQTGILFPTPVACRGPPG
jgi:hypothetical protein